MKTVVIDVSVAAKWILPAAGESLREEAFDLLGRYSANEILFLVPDLFWTELANALWNAVRRRRFSALSASEGLSSVQDRVFPTVSSRSLVNEAFRIAMEFDRAVYDSLYIALALASETTFVTADQKLVNAVSSRLTVRLLGSI